MDREIRQIETDILKPFKSLYDKVMQIDRQMYGQIDLLIDRKIDRRIENQLDRDYFFKPFKSQLYKIERCMDRQRDRE